MPGFTQSNRLIVALDFSSAATALALVDRMEGRCAWFKVGLELYYGAGGSIVEKLRARGVNVFLDLKLHDIPNTVAAAVRSVSSLGASLLTIHAAGGAAMMEAAVSAASVQGSPRLLAVTVLTSMNTAQLTEIGIPSSPAAQVVRLAQLACASGISGFICSPEEIVSLRAKLPSDSLLVVPGIRPQGAIRDDQSRIATPSGALNDGASMLVVGRPITQAPDPVAAIDSILAEMAATVRTG